MRIHFTRSIKPACAVALAMIASCAPSSVGTRQSDRLELSRRMQAHSVPQVLFIGNSYSFGVPHSLEKLATQRGRPVKIAQVTYSRWTLARHARNDATLRKIRECHWDVIVLQELSRTPSVPIQRDLMMFPAVRKLAAEARKQGAIPVLYQTWGYRNGDPNHAHDDFHAMTCRVREGYAKAAKKAGGLLVISVGDAWEREFSAGHGGDLFMPDGSHPTPYGNRVAAETFASTLFVKS